MNHLHLSLIFKDLLSLQSNIMMDFFLSTHHICSEILFSVRNDCFENGFLEYLVAFVPSTTFIGELVKHQAHHKLLITFSLMLFNSYLDI